MADIIQLVQFKRGTKANLEAVLIGTNKLIAGEPVWELDTNKFKIGNGTSDYADLPYISGGEGPNEYLKNATVSGKVLTITKHDGTSVVLDAGYAPGDGIDILNNIISVNNTIARQAALEAETTRAEAAEATLSTAISEKSTVSVSESGSAANEVQYITVDGTEYKLPGGTAPVSSIVVYQGDIELGRDKLAKIAELTAGKTLHKGDIAIIRELIDTDKYEYTAFVYTGTAWAAMDGNYNAENVYFAKDIIYTKAIGELDPVSASGSGTIAAKGKNVKQVFDTILAKEKNPTPVFPSLTINSSNIGEKEVGENITINYETAFDAGKYSFGPDTGVTASNYKIMFNNQTLTTASGIFDSVQVTEDTNLKITGTFDHTQGVIPVTNLGNEYPGARIPAWTSKPAVEKGALSGYRKMFYGTRGDKTDLTSDKIRALLNEKVDSKSVTVPITVGSMRTIIAVPNTKTVTSIKDMNASGAELLSAFSLITLNVEGANNYMAIPYKVYILDYAEALTVANEYKVVIA